MTFTPGGETDVPRIASLISTAFTGTVEDCEKWVRSGPLTDTRTVRSGSGCVDACMRRIPMGQFFGRRSVPMIGVAGVAVAPESRGQGHARLMMRAALQEMHERGEPLSALYASTQPLYRQVGYEQAGYRVQFTLPLSELRGADRGEPGRWEPVGFEGYERLVPCYRAFAGGFDGPLDRGPYVWKRIFDWRDRKAVGYAHLDDDGGVDAYAVVAQKRKDNGRVSLELTDAAFTSAPAGERLLGMLHDYASMADDLSFHGGPAHPLLALVAQQRATAAYREAWMLRLVRVADALRLRGYSPAVNAEVHLHVTDSTLDSNNGPIVLRIRDGAAEASPGGRAEVRLSERALASLYSGFASPAWLRLSGLVNGQHPALATLASAFSGNGTPWMADFF
ncbi:MAG: GNAT family N-acetyltransferase [Phycisphaerales bacterium]|nr:GNAT family N-acetyltransferase [Phycisphaerales bacterium]